jgi:Ca2+-transporting ATPase
MAALARQITVIVVVAAVLAFGVGILRGEGSGEMFKVAVALAVAAVPEGLPVIVTIVLAVGVRRMARRQAIVRHLPAVETLGSTTVIGSDKTGTLTENRLTVQAIWADGLIIPLADLPRTSRPFAEPLRPAGELSAPELTLLTGVLANEATWARTEDGFETHGDPTEVALLWAAQASGLDPEGVRIARPVLAEIPFEPERQYSASVRANHGIHEIFVKGAPERVLPMCESLLTAAGPVPLDAAMVQAAVHDLAGRGLRVLAMAYGPLPHQPPSLETISEPVRLTLVGLQGMMDPPREGVREAIARCREAGIRVIMITGDHAATACAISRDLGIGSDDRVLTGAELATLDDEALQAVVQDVDVFARIAPEQKLRIVRALQEDGEIVAVTGDGVNDAPALKAANIGVAMGRSGTDVAREAAEIVLANDNFITIVNAVEEGRVTFDNVRRTTFFLIATGAAEVLIILGALALGWPAPLVPAQILWLNLVTDGLEDEALAFEPGEPDVLERPPRSPREGIISRLLWERTVLTALVIAVGTLALFRWELARSGSLLQAQTVALTTLVVFEAFQAGNARSERRSLFRLNPFSNRFLLVGTVAAVGIHLVALYVPPAQFVLRVAPIDIAAWIRIILVAATVIVAVEVHKWLRRTWPGSLACQTAGA